MYCVQRMLLLLRLVSHRLINYNLFLLSDLHHDVHSFHNETAYCDVDRLLVALWRLSQ